MKTKAERFDLTKDDVKKAVETFSNDIRLDYDDGCSQEWWIGEKGTTNVRVIYWSDENDEGELVNFGKTISELRRDPIFISALLNDADVNHSLPLHNNPIPEDEFKRLLEWLTGRTNEMPITACGAYNYYFDYIQPN